MNGLVSFIFFLILLEKIRFSEVATHLVSGLRVCVCVCGFGGPGKPEG